MLQRPDMHRRIRGLLALGALLLGTGAEAARRPPPRRDAQHAKLPHRAAARARAWVGLRSLGEVSRAVNDDCSGLATLAYHGRAVRLLPDEYIPGENGVTAIHRKARQLGALRVDRPRPGDLVFFRETYDRNRDGRWNDGLTHIGVVERVGADGTVTFVHRASGGVKRSRLNLLFPDVRRDEQGRVLNDWLRRRDAKTRGFLAGELVAGFASVDERWRPAPVPPRGRARR